MKMKSALSIILGGALLVGSSSFIFANDGIKLPSTVQEQSTVVNEASIETTETPKVTIEVLDEIIEKVDGSIITDLEEEELLELIEDILAELEEEAEEGKEELEEEADEEEEDEIDDEDEDDEDENKELVLENLYRKLLKYQLVYDRVPAQAKPAIQKNMKKMQLKIVQRMLKMDEDLEKLIPEINVEVLQTELAILKEKLQNTELTEEAKKEIMDSIATLEMKVANHEELTKLVEFVKGNENWHKELKNKIHDEFKEEKAKVKVESKLAKEEIKKARKEVQEQIKANKKVDKDKEKDVKKGIKKDIDENIKKYKEINDKKEVVNKNEVKNDKIDKTSAETKVNEPTYEKAEKKAHPVKENHPGNAKGKNK